MVKRHIDVYNSARCSFIGLLLFFEFVFEDLLNFQLDSKVSFSVVAIFIYFRKIYCNITIHNTSTVPMSEKFRHGHFVLSVR